MGKTLKNHNFVTLYIREKYKNVYYKALELFEKDKEVTKFRNKPRDGLVSVWFCEQLNKYVFEKTHGGDTNETNASAHTEEKDV